MTKTYSLLSGKKFTRFFTEKKSACRRLYSQVKITFNKNLFNIDISEQLFINKPAHITELKHILKLIWSFKMIIFTFESTTLKYHHAFITWGVIIEET